MNTDMESYKTFVDVFKGYLDTALTANIWFYALTGAVVSYYLKNRENARYLKFSLILPFVLGILIIVLSGAGIGQAHLIEGLMLKASGLRLEHVPAAEVLVNFFKASIGLISAVCIGLILLFIFLEDFRFKTGIVRNKWLRRCFWILFILLICGYFIWLYRRLFI